MAEIHLPQPGDIIEAGVKIGRRVHRRTCTVERSGNIPREEQGPFLWATGRFRTDAGHWSVKPRALLKPWRTVRPATTDSAVGGET